jgi:hypothetical protein
MLGNRKLVVDTFSEISDLIRPWIDVEFWDLQQHDIIPGAIYIIGRQQFNANRDFIVDLIHNQTVDVVFTNPAEGSETVITHCEFGLKVMDLLGQGKIPLITGGDIPTQYPHLLYESFLPKLYDYVENTDAAQQYQDQYSAQRPYKFLFLNGRQRDHRRHMISLLRPVLDQALWTNLDSGNGPLHLLPAGYEPDMFDSTVDTTVSVGLIKNQLFRGIWGEIYLKSRPYQDTYFSVVTETVFDYPYSFRTEKIWKPIAMGHPFIVAANAGYYRDLRRLGFQTFGHVIDESFDSIDNNQDRQARIVEVIKDLCQQDLASFLDACYNTCKYNQQHLADMRLQVRAEFPNRFEQFIRERFRI